MLGDSTRLWNGDIDDPTDSTEQTEILKYEQNIFSISDIISNSMETNFSQYKICGSSLRNVLERSYIT